MGQICIHIVRKTGRIHKHTQYKMSLNVIYRWAQSKMKEQFWYWSNGTSYHKSDPVKGWTCWGHNLQVESNSDTPQMPLKGKNTGSCLVTIFPIQVCIPSSYESLLSPMLELRLLRGLAQVTELKKILSWEYSRVTSFPLKIYTEDTEVQVRLK